MSSCSVKSSCPRTIGDGRDSADAPRLTLQSTPAAQQSLSCWKSGFPTAFRLPKSHSTDMSAARKSWTLIALAAFAVATLTAIALTHDSGSHRPAAGPHAYGARFSRASAVPTSPALIATRRPRGTPVRVTIAARAEGQVSASDFLGLSFELRSLPELARYATRGNLVTLLRSLGRGVLRFGGTSADEQVAWVANPAAAGREALPRWASTAIDARDLAGIATLARESGWRVLLTVNLGHYDPAAAAQEAGAARAALGSALVGIELGNEPDRYIRKGLRGRGWDFAAYRAQAAAYRAAIAAAAPGVAIAEPDPSSGVPGLTWLRGAARSMHPQLLTDHYYPLSSCGYRPTVSELLSVNVRRADGAMLAKMLAIARAAGTRLRIDETNSVSCEGFAGVSDTFGSALWALDYTAQALDAGVAGLNFHDLLAKRDAYSPLIAISPTALAAGALRAQPEWYALLAARELRGSEPLRTSIAPATGGAATGGGLDASAFRAPDGRLRLVLVDYDPPGSQPLAVSLRVPRAPSGSRAATTAPAARAPAHTHARGGVASAYADTYTAGSVLRLTGPSPAATAGVRLAGRAVSADGSWRPPAALPGVYDHRGALSVQLAPSSAAVVTLYPG